MLDFRQSLINSTLNKVLQRRHNSLEVKLTGPVALGNLAQKITNEINVRFE